MNTANQQATEPRQDTPLSWFRSAVDKRRKEFLAALPSDVNVDRFIRTLMTTAQMRPELFEADSRSLVAACMKAAQDGLFPDGREAVLNVYKTKVANDWVPMVQYLPMVRGLLKIMRNSGEISYVDAAAVYERDEFIFERGDNARLIHSPYLGEEEPGNIVAAYCIARFHNGEVHREVMTRRDLNKVKSSSKSGTGDNSPWVKWEDQMSIKSVIKRAYKLLPGSSERLETVIEHDNEAQEFDFAQPATMSNAPQLQQTSVAALTNKTNKQTRTPRLGGLLGLDAEPVLVTPPTGDAPDGAENNEGTNVRH